MGIWVLLSVGTIYAFIPIVIIIILIAAAVALTRGSDLFAVFGIGTLLGIRGTIGTGSTGRGLKTGAQIPKSTVGTFKRSGSKMRAEISKTIKFQKSRAAGKVSGGQQIEKLAGEYMGKSDADRRIIDNLAKEGQAALASGRAMTDIQKNAVAMKAAYEAVNMALAAAPIIGGQALYGAASPISASPANQAKKEEEGKVKLATAVGFIPRFDKEGNPTGKHLISIPKPFGQTRADWAQRGAPFSGTRADINNQNAYYRRIHDAFRARTDQTTYAATMQAGGATPLMSFRGRGIRQAWSEYRQRAAISQGTSTANPPGLIGMWRNYGKQAGALGLYGRWKQARSMGKDFTYERDYIDPRTGQRVHIAEKEVPPEGQFIFGKTRRQVRRASILGLPRRVAGKAGAVAVGTARYPKRWRAYRRAIKGAPPIPTTPTGPKSLEQQIKDIQDRINGTGRSTPTDKAELQSLQEQLKKQGGGTQGATPAIQSGSNTGKRRKKRKP